MEQILLEFVKEKHIIPIILEYKEDCELIDTFHNYYRTNHIFAYIRMLREIDELFLEKNEEYLNWRCIIQHKKLSINFIEKYLETIIEKNLLKEIILFQKLSEEFLEKHIELFNHKLWYFISLKQNLSNNFIKNHKAELSIGGLMENSNY
jgi:hypothetical protein